MCTLESGVNVGLRLLILGLFSRGYVLIKGAKFINFWNFYFSYIFFPLAIYEIFKLSVILCGATLIQGATLIVFATSILDSRVLCTYMYCYIALQVNILVRSANSCTQHVCIIRKCFISWFSISKNLCRL